jgi:hypothetical protein
MTPEELTEISNIHQKVLSRHDKELAGIRALLSLSNSQHSDEIKAVRKLIELNQEQLNTLTAGQIQLQNMVADYIASREKP